MSMLLPLNNAASTPGERYPAYASSHLHVFSAPQPGARVLFVGLKDYEDPTPVYQDCVVTAIEGLYLNRSNPPR